MRNFLILGLLIPAAALGQTPTVGTLAFVPDSVSPGYTLYQPHNQPDAFLLNFCGEVVHRWEAADTLRPGNSAYLLPNGDLVRALRPAVTAGDAIWAGGGGATNHLNRGDRHIDLGRSEAERAEGLFDFSAVAVLDGSVGADGAAAFRVMRAVVAGCAAFAGADLDVGNDGHG